MIYTLTLNPALDYVVRVPNFVAGQVNRMSESTLLPGGKGINVSIMLKNLGVDSIAWGFCAGFTGRELSRILEEINCRADFLELPEGDTRINVKLKTTEETEVNAPGPPIPASATLQLLEKAKNLQPGDILVLAGSVPKGVPDTIYQELAKICKEKEADFVVDAEKDLLLNTLSYQPFLVKPNHHELGTIFNTVITDRNMAVTYAKALQKKGARNVLVSLGRDGAVLLAENGEEYDVEAPSGQLVNSTGAGDSMVAGFLTGFLKEKNYVGAVCLGIAAGSATAFSEGLAEGEKVFELYQTIKK